MHRILTVAVVTFLSALPAVVPTHAQASRATLMGTVYDPLGEPIEGMLVYLESGAFGSGVSDETRTNKAGEYRFEKLPPGVYTISVPIEFAQPVEVALDEGKLVRQDIRMHIEQVAATFSVCIDCGPAVPRYVPPDSLVKEFATDRDAAAKQSVRGAEPAVGWEYYQPDVRVTDVIRARGLTGAVVLEMRIETDGAIKDVTVVSSPHAELSAAAVAAVQNDRWNAATVRGVPLAVPQRLTIDFVRATPK
ncbi:MAG TPA: TonB family protein [Vicinamibacterales bacterium]